MADREYISDPALLEALGAPQAAPAAPEGDRQYISDPALLAQLEGAEQARAPGASTTPVGPFGNEVQAGVSSALNTGTLNLYRNALAAGTYGLGKLGVPGYPDMPFGEHYDRWKAYDERVNRENPKSAIAGTIAGGVGAALAAPAILPEASMAALYAGGAGALGRSAAIGGGMAGISTGLDTHDLGKAATAATIGAVAGPVADKVTNVARPLFSKAQTLVPREVEAIGGALTRGTPEYVRDRVGSVVRQGVGASVGGAAGAGAGALVGSVLPGEYSPYAASVIGAGAAGEAGRRAMAQMQREQKALKRDRKYYPKGNGASSFVGAVVPQALYGLLGGGDGR